MPLLGKPIVTQGPASPDPAMFAGEEPDVAEDGMIAPDYIPGATDGALDWSSVDSYDEGD